MRAKLDFEAIFDASPNPYMVVDDNLRYVAANAAYLNITRRRREDLLGQRVTDVDKGFEAPAALEGLGPSAGSRAKL